MGAAMVSQEFIQTSFMRHAKHVSLLARLVLTALLPAPNVYQT